MHSVEQWQLRKAETVPGEAIASIVLNWKKPLLTASCVRSLLASDDVNHLVVVVDNGSGDGSVGYLREQFPQVKVLASDENRGFSAGCNLGIRFADSQGATHVGIINNDLTVESSSIRSALDRFPTDKSIAAVTGKIFGPERGRLWQAGGHIDHSRVMGIPRGYGQIDRRQYEEACETGWASGAMSVFALNAFREIGFMAEEYFFGQEEWDFSTAFIRRGYQIWYEPNFVGHHGSGGSYKKHPALNSYGAVRNRHLYAEKYLSPRAYQVWRLRFYFHLQLRMKSKLRRLDTHEDVDRHVRAMRLGWNRHVTGQAVTLSELAQVSRELGISDDWASS